MSKVIYALFDDGNQSVKKTMEPLGYKVYSFGIQDKDTVIKCDLTDLENFFKVSKKLPLPDFIMANPPCETFSIGTACRYEDGKNGTIY
ncbi:DNA cytosine methyltransferase, partial [Brucella sp. CMUL 015]|uniref:DNA cytosine methyltransferase n=1 Tax=Brucella sp. CMUL 015 TaxID=1905697 RepID=UPI001177DB81